MEPSEPASKVLSLRECVRWCDRRGFRLDEREHPARPSGRHLKLFEVPTLSRGRIELARVLIDWPDPSISLLWVTDWPLYLEDAMSLFLELRGDEASRNLISAPGLTFSPEPEDQTRLVHFVYLILAFNWEGFLLNGDPNSFIWLADEVIEVVSNDKKRLAELGDAGELWRQPLREVIASRGPVHGQALREYRMRGRYTSSPTGTATALEKARLAVTS